MTRRAALLTWGTALFAALGTFVAGSRAARRYRRFAIVGDSMLPALRRGDFVVADMRAYRSKLPRPGDLVVALDPREVSRTLVKRVERYDPGSGAWLLGDNPGESTDSRTFGHVAPGAVLGRLMFRYWPLGRRTAP